MLCSKCLKEIPEGKEVQLPIYEIVSERGRGYYHTKHVSAVIICCKECAIEEKDKHEKQKFKRRKLLIRSAVVLIAIYAISILAISLTFKNKTST